jgi:hypothetical protein
MFVLRRKNSDFYDVWDWVVLHWQMSCMIRESRITCFLTKLVKKFQIKKLIFESFSI